MKSLYVRIYLTLVVLLLAFAFGAAWLFQRQMEHERVTYDAAAYERLANMGVLIHHSLPPATAPREEQAAAIRFWGQRLRLAVALLDDKGERIGASEFYERREEGPPNSRPVELSLDDGRTMVLLRRQMNFGQMGPGGPGGPGGPNQGQGTNRREPVPNPFAPLPWMAQRSSGEALAIVLVLLFLGVALGAYPVVRRLTRRLEALKAGVEQFGSGDLSKRVEAEGNDEVAALGRSFNYAAARIESLLRSQKNLLANASHELRSPLARLKMAFSMLEELPTEAARARLGAEIHTNIAELDALVEEVLLASRLETGGQNPNPEPVDLLGLGVEEASRIGADVEPSDGLVDLKVLGEERLLRRALRNLLENARRYGGDEVALELRRVGDNAEIRICDRGPGVPEPMRERIFEAFFRLPGHAEQAGGVGLGLSLVKQIAQRHGGSVHCEARPGGGSVFVFTVPVGSPTPGKP
ncbi:MAG TPA: ATP-binding protein [Burkholderiaceae bacterium]|jgi:signal transduction histidine kinase